MSFLQPWLLAALPIAALPVIIHLIHQRRFQSVEWGAMRFLLEAQRMARGYARLRQLLILLVRVLAIAALVFLISRPLATGWLGLAGGGRPDTTLILIDRSASMLQQDEGTVSSKLETGVAQLGRTLSTLGSGRWVLIDSVSNRPTELATPAELSQSPLVQSASAAADLPAMLQTAHDYITNNRTGQTEIWICSDLRTNDWNAESGRWKALHDSFQKFQQSVRLHLLAYPSVPTSNVAVRVTDVQRRATGDTAALLLSVQLTRQGGEGKLSVPLQFDVEGARSELTVEMEGRELDLKNHSIPITGNRVRGWGRVSIPADQNPADNEFYFTFDAPPPRKTILVTHQRDETRPLELAASSSPDPTIKSEVEVVGPDQLSAIPWEQVALVLWAAPIPSAEVGDTIRQFVDRGGQVVFFPPREPNDEKIFETRWTKWESPEDPIRVEAWRGDQDLFARTQSGAALPVGELTVRRYCGLAGDVVALASLTGGAPLLARVTTDHGGVYFCTTSPAAADSSLGTNGVALYVAIQRALAAGAAQLSKTKQLAAGTAFPKSANDVRPVAGAKDALSTEYPYHAGVYEADSGILAVNREAAEDRPAVLGDGRVAELFRGLDFDRVDDQAGNMKSLAREVWRMCVGAMMIAIVAEAGLCLPRAAPRTGGCRVTSTSTLTFLATPWTIVAAIFVWLVLAVLSFVAWRNSGYRRSIGLLEVLRLAILALIGVILNQPEWVETYHPTEKPTIGVLWDASASMATRDVVAAGSPTSAAPVTRKEAVEPLTNDSAWQPLRDKFNVVLQQFSEPHAGGGTNLSGPLTKSVETLNSLAGVVLISDGDWNEGEPPAEAAVRMRMANVPVFTVPVGSPQRLPDIELLSLDAPTFGVAGKSVRIPFTIESTLPREYVTTVVLKTSTGDEVSKEIHIAPQGRTSDSINWKPKESGNFTVTLDIPKQADETIPDNNKLTVPIAIREEKLRVLVVESLPRWEYRYLRNALSRDPGIELSCLLFHPGLDKVGGGNKDYIKQFPNTLEALAKFDVVFLGDVGLDNNQLTLDDCRLLRGLVEYQASGLVFMPGMQGRQFSLLETPLKDIYPVVLDETQPNGWGTRTASHFQLTELGERSLLTKLADSQQENADVWDNLPGFQWYAPVTRAKAGSEVLCVHSDASSDFGRLPLVVTQTYGAGKVLFMGTDGAWRWRKGVEDKYHYRFWGQVVRWMAYQRNMAKGETMRLYYSPDQPQLNKTITLKANVMERTGEPLAKGDVSARIVAPTGRAQTIQFTSLNDEWGAFTGQYISDEPGQHQVALSCRQTGATLDATFFVQGAAKEPVGRPARPEVLEEIARVSRGKMIGQPNTADILGYLRNLPEPPPVERRLQIWCHPITASIVICMFGVFWIARKAVGLI